MNKSELIAAVAAQVGSDPSQARRHVDAVFETIMSSVVAGERVVVTGFGTFDRVTRSARTVRNPRTGQPIQVATSLAPHFSVGRTFKQHVSGATPAAPASAAEEVPVSAPPSEGKKKKKKRKNLAASNGGKKAKSAKSAKKAARKGN